MRRQPRVSDRWSADWRDGRQAPDTRRAPDQSGSRLPPPSARRAVLHPHIRKDGDHRRARPKQCGQLRKLAIHSARSRRQFRSRYRQMLRCGRSAAGHRWRGREFCNAARRHPDRGRALRSCDHRTDRQRQLFDLLPEQRRSEPDHQRHFEAEGRRTDADAYSIPARRNGCGIDDDSRTICFAATSTGEAISARKVSTRPSICHAAQNAAPSIRRTPPPFVPVNFRQSIAPLNIHRGPDTDTIGNDGRVRRLPHERGRHACECRTVGGVHQVANDDFNAPSPPMPSPRPISAPAHAATTTRRGAGSASTPPAWRQSRSECPMNI